MQRGSLIIYDNTGKVWINTGDAEGDILPHEPPAGLPYIITEFGQLNGKIVKAVDVMNKTLITEDTPIMMTEEQQKIQELETQLLISEGVI